jgi:hypothetical protein
MVAAISSFRKKKTMKISERFYLPELMKPATAELDDVSERAVALLAAAIIDESLTQIIKLRLIDEPKMLKEIFEGQGGLATFSAKIAMGRLMNFYSAETFSDLNIIRKIRNDAAHATQPFSFRNEPHRNRALALKIPEKHLFEIGTETDNANAAMFVYGIDEVQNEPLLCYVGAAIFLAWNFTGWADQQPEHLRPQGLKNGAI